MENQFFDKKNFVGALVLSLILAFFFEIIKYRYGHFRTEDNWVFAFLGLFLFSYLAVIAISWIFNKRAPEVSPGLSQRRNLGRESPKTPRTETSLINLPFKNNESAFEYACKFMDNDLREGVGLLALVLDAKELYNLETSVPKDDSGIQIVALKVASNDGGFEVMAQTLSANGPNLNPGDLVVWEVGTYLQELANTHDDERFGWVGLILGTLKPVWANGSWEGDERFV